MRATGKAFLLKPRMSGSAARTWPCWEYYWLMMSTTRILVGSTSTTWVPIKVYCTVLAAGACASAVSGRIRSAIEAGSWTPTDTGAFAGIVALGRDWSWRTALRIALRSAGVSMSGADGSATPRLPEGGLWAAAGPASASSSRLPIKKRGFPRDIVMVHLDPAALLRASTFRKQRRSRPKDSRRWRLRWIGLAFSRWSANARLTVLLHLATSSSLRKQGTHTPCPLDACGVWVPALRPA